jgi:L-fucose isomerase-like protein
MADIKVRIGFIGLYRVGVTNWCKRALKQSLQNLSKVRGLELVLPQAGPGDEPGGNANCCAEHGMVGNLDEAEAAADYLSAQKVDGLILCPLDFGDERAASKVAELLRVPVMLYATKEPPADDLPPLARKSDSYCGNLTIAAGLHHRGISFHFAGLFHPAESGLKNAAREFVRAVAAVKAVKGARVAQIGLRPEGFEAVSYSEVALASKFGINVIPANLGEITSRAHEYPDDSPKVLAVTEEIRGQYSTITISDTSLLTTAKLELALIAFWNRHGLSAQAMQCWGPAVRRSLGITPCVAFGRMTQNHRPCACEADILGALSMLLTHRAALGRSVPHLIDWTIQHREDPNKLLAWHCGNAPPCLARPGQTLALRSRRDMKGELPIDDHDIFAGLGQFQLKPGPVTLCKLENYGDEWKMLITKGEAKSSDEVLSGTWSWVEVPDHQRLYRTLVEEGFIHHASLIHDDQTQALLLACKFLDIRPVVVDAA